MDKDMIIDSELNEDCDEWLQYSDSLWYGRKIDVIRRIIKIFTNPEDVILDPFMGKGSTLVAANTLDRKAIGFEINEKYISTADEKLESYKGSYQIIHDSCININKYLYDESVDLCVTSPPCWNISHVIREGYKNIGNTNSYSCYLKNLAKVFSVVYEVLKPNKMCIVIVMDIRKRNRLYPLHIDLTNIMNDIGFTLEDFIIWDCRKEHIFLKAVDDTCIYKTNIVHENICIFRKPLRDKRKL